MSNVVIRKALLNDSAQILQLMRQLAEFEGYADQFKVTQQTIETRCIENPDIGIFVAETNSAIKGILVYFIQPFTYDLSPWLIVKELYIAEDARSLGIGRQLMQAAATHCLQIGGTKMKWEVLTKNDKAKAFYQSLGAELTDDWQTMSLSCLLYTSPSPRDS